MKINIVLKVLVITFCLTLFQNCGLGFHKHKKTNNEVEELNLIAFFNSLVFNGGFDNNVEPTGVVRLTPIQYKASIEEFTGYTISLDEFRADPQISHLNNNSNFLYFDSTLLELISKTANTIASDSDLDINQFFNCNNQRDLNSNSVCLNNNLDKILLKAFRRPTNNAEKQIYLSIYEDNFPGEGHNFSLRLVLQTILMSPNFLYNQQMGDNSNTLNAFEVASKISYFLTNNPPDDTLMSLAQSDELLNPIILKAQAQRLINTNDFNSQINNFIFQWLGLNANLLNSKTNSSYDQNKTDILKTALTKETELLIDDVLKNEATLKALLSRNYTFANRDLKEFYPNAPDTNSFQQISLEGTSRLGVVGLPLTMISHSKDNNEPSPIQKGVLMREHLFCQKFPAAFGTPVAILPKDPTGLLTHQERFDSLNDVTGCYQCHQYLNSGFALEKFDNVGRELFNNPFQVDFSGTLDGTQSFGYLNNPVTDKQSYSTTRESLQVLAEAPAVYQCFTRQLMRFAQQRVEKETEFTEINDIMQIFLNSNGNIKEAALNIVMSQAFLSANK